MKSRFTYLTILIFFLIDLAHGQWVSIGPEGGWVEAIVFHPAAPETVYAGGDFRGGFYKSTDSGINWERNESYGADNSWCIAIDPDTPEIIYVGNLLDDSVGIKKSTNGGSTWTTILDSPDIASIAIDPSNTDVIYAAAGQWEQYQERGDGIWKSTDSGITWQHIGLDTFNVQKVVINPDSTNILYAAVYPGCGTPHPGAGIYKSNDSGANWTMVGLADKYLWDLKICPDSTNVLFAVAWDSLHRTTDAGQSWHSIPLPGSPWFHFTVAIAPSDGKTIYMGTMDITPTPGDDGVFKSTDRGEIWTTINTGLLALRPWVITIHPTNPDIVLQGQQGRGIWRTDNGGGTWSEVNTGYICHYGFDLAVDQSSNLYAGFYGETFNNHPGVRRWLGGTSWQELGIRDTSIRVLRIDPQSAQTIFAATQFESGNEGFLYRSDNAGVSWSKIGTGLPDSIHVEALAIDPSTTTILYAGTAGEFPTGRGVYKSTDRGENWFAVGLDGSWISDLAIDPNATQTIYASTMDNIYKSTDGGAVWQPLGLSGIAVFCLELNPLTPNIIFAGTYLLGVLRSPDGGSNWQQVGLDGKSVTVMAIDPVRTDTIYAGGSWLVSLPGIGIYRSTDGGDNWQDYSEGLSSLDIASITVDPTDTDIIYAGTLGHAIYRRDVGIGVEEEPTANIRKNYFATIISGPLQLPKDKRCRVFDITGREIKPERLRPGIYFIEVEGEISQKIIKIR